MASEKRGDGVSLDRRQAEKVLELLEGWSLVLRSTLPQRLIDLLKDQVDQTGVYEPLRYEPPMGPDYVADEADAIARTIREQLT